MADPSDLGHGKKKVLGGVWRVADDVRKLSHGVRKVTEGFSKLVSE